VVLVGLPGKKIEKARKKSKGGQIGASTALVETSRNGEKTTREQGEGHVCTCKRQNPGSTKKPNVSRSVFKKPTTNRRMRQSGTGPTPKQKTRKSAEEIGKISEQRKKEDEKEAFPKASIRNMFEEV